MVAIDETVAAPVIDGHRQFIEARIRATATGRPRVTAPEPAIVS